MSLVAGDIQVFLTGGALNTDPSLSLGGAKSDTQIDTAALNNLFDYVSEDEAAAGSEKYRALIVRNGGSSTWYNVFAYLSGATLSANTAIAITLDDGGAQTIASEDNAPAGLAAFASPIVKADGLAIGDLAAGATAMIWIRRTVTAGATILDDSIGLVLQGGNAP